MPRMVPEQRDCCPQRALSGRERHWCRTTDVPGGGPQEDRVSSQLGPGPRVVRRGLALCVDWMVLDQPQGSGVGGRTDEFSGVQKGVRRGGGRWGQHGHLLRTGALVVTCFFVIQ
jgi:hypothetical protein